MSPKEARDAFKRIAGAAIKYMSGSDRCSSEMRPNGSAQIVTEMPRYEVYDTSRGIVLKIGDYVLGNVVDQFFFSADDFKSYPGSLEVIAAASERSNKIWKESGPRLHSGLPGPDHPTSVARIAAENAKAVGVKPTVSNYISTIGHDDIEELVAKFYKAWKTFAVLAHYEAEPAQRKEYERVKDNLKTHLDNTRDSYKNEKIRDLENAIPDDVPDTYVQQLRGAIEEGADNVLRLTRFPDENIYPKSMGIQFGRIRNESLGKMLSRQIGKFADRTRNTQEYKTDANLAQLLLAYNDGARFGDSTIGEALIRKYGRANPNPKEMVPSMMVQTAFGTIPSAHYFNEKTGNKYAAKISKSEDDELIELLRWARHSRDMAIDAAHEMFRLAIQKFEERPEIIAQKPNIDMEVQAKKRSRDFFTRVTSGDAILTLTRLDVMGRRYIEERDATSEGMLQTYKDARVLQIQIPSLKKYKDRHAESNGSIILYDDPEKFDPEKHEWFTIKDMDSGVRMLPNLEDMFGVAMYNEAKKEEAKLRDDKDLADLLK